MGSDTKNEVQVTVAAGQTNRPVPYEKPVLIPVGNLHDLLAAGGTQNADPGGPGGPFCTSGGIFLDTNDC